MPEPSNPLRSDNPSDWDRLIEDLGPASLMLVIERRMGSAVRRRHAPEDVWQEVLLHAWRDREKIEWRGIKAFRGWILRAIEHRIFDLADRERAQKRGGDRMELRVSDVGGSNNHASAVQFPQGLVSTTPSRVAMYREQAEAMRLALDHLPEELRGVVELRLFEQLPMAQIAQRLGIGISAAFHRFRKGSELYQRRLMSELATRAETIQRLSMESEGEADGSAPPQPFLPSEPGS